MAVTGGERERRPINLKRLFLIALLSPILAFLTATLLSSLGSIVVPRLEAVIVLQLAGFGLYGWVAGRFGGRGSGVAVAIGLGPSWGLLAVWLTGLGHIQGGKTFALVVLSNVAVAAIAAEVAGWRGIRREEAIRSEDSRSGNREVPTEESSQ